MSDSVAKTTDQQYRAAIVLTSDVILALDIEQALESIAYRTWINHDYDLANLESSGPSKIDIAIVEVQPGDSHSNVSLIWLQDRGVPTVVLSTSDLNPNSYFAGMQQIVGSFTKPVHVDKILPFVSSLTEDSPQTG
ncbi:hypothetical protein [Pseudoruegeria sp. HB172150]|uniref:hypothetical protein n=1 Tax=Pseudoruegeria sp. HB172150 TaxID=2721164 RepID=UPI001C1318B1|nr:hypothetical protein [Pseudoruegeria sp. HB172150]